MDYGIIRQWLERVNYNNLKTQIGNREVAIWGAYSGGKEVQNVLESNGISVSYYIDAHKEQVSYQGKKVLHPNQLKNTDLFIFVAVTGVRTEIMDYLNSLKLKDNIDYIYISKHIPQITLIKCSGLYEDMYGNKMEFEDDQIKCAITLIGYDNKVSIGKGFVAEKKAHIVVENGSQITVGNYTNLHREVLLEAIDGGKIEIGNNCVIARNSRMSSRGAMMKLGNKVTVGERFLCLNGKTAYVVIGNDCMFSNDVSVIGYSGHSIFDLVEKENVALRDEKFVKIGNHVWAGKSVTILHNAEIGDGCIIGANSLVKLHAKNNCIVAGNPAKIVKENHTWDRRIGISYDDL